MTVGLDESDTQSPSKWQCRSTNAEKLQDVLGAVVCLVSVGEGKAVRRIA